MKITYLLTSFPQLSETFITNEIDEIKAKHIQVSIFSIKKPNQHIVHKKAKELAKETYYVSDKSLSNSSRIVFLHIYFLSSRPLRYIKVFIFALKHKKGDLFWYFKQSVVYAYLIKKSKSEHIHSHYAASTATQYAMLISMLLDIPFSFTAHGWYDIFTYAPKNFRDLAQKAKRVITVSRYNKNYLIQKYKMPPDKIEVIHCGIDINFFKPAKDSNKENIILTVARLHPVKGLEYAIKACALLKQKANRFKYFIVGEGSEHSKLEHLIRNLQLQDYVFLEGARVKEEVLKYYQKAKIFILPSITEGLPVSLMESMACKVPVIATKICGVPELVEDGINGYLVPPKDVQQLAQKMEILLNNPELCEKFGNQGRKKVEAEFNLKKEVKKLISLMTQ